MYEILRLECFERDDDGARIPRTRLHYRRCFQSLESDSCNLADMGAKGLIKPARLGKNRFYSKCDIDRLEQIKDLLQTKRINIEGVKRILSTTRCWEIRRCKLKERDSCQVYRPYGKGWSSDQIDLNRSRLPPRQILRALSNLKWFGRLNSLKTSHFLCLLWSILKVNVYTWFDQLIYVPSFSFYQISLGIALHGHYIKGVGFPHVWNWIVCALRRLFG